MTPTVPEAMAPIPARTPTLRVRGLHKSFCEHQRGSRRRVVLDGVDLDVEAGSFTVLTGPTGSGKSSLLRCVYRTYLADAGTITVNSAAGPVSIIEASDRQILLLRTTTIGMVSQFLACSPRVSAIDLVASQGISREEASTTLSRLGLSPEVAALAPTSFSGGERQVVGLAVALARPRPILLLDEVTASLDPARRAAVLRLIAERKAAGTTILAVFHDLPEVAGLVDQVVQLAEGRIAPA